MDDFSKLVQNASEWDAGQRSDWRDTPTQTGSTLKPTESSYLGNNLYNDLPATAIVIVVSFCAALLATDLSRKAPAAKQDGVLMYNGKLNWLVLAGLFFIMLKGMVDLYVSLSINNAFNFLLGLGGIAISLAPFTYKFNTRFVLLAGVWMITRGVLNFVLLASMTNDLSRFFLTMKITQLPNLAFNYAAPIFLGFYFLQLKRAQKMV